ncbi:unnamed protein product [Schistosoma mattheei]|uniref:Uncharacterized protein n=1 Tax=Schistosoma mattheei TaxID=31246 RepID=A0A183NW74_9TREM|nr:unnamed protein product [Schistosoma mattheei]
MDLTSVVVFCLCIGLSQSIFFHMKETEERCFLEDVPEDTLVAGKHFERSKDLGVKVKVIDPHDQILLDRVYSSEGRFVFTAHRPGEYKICISSDSGAWFGGSQLVREESFRSLSESTNRRVTWWSVAQLVLLICIGFWQMRHLRAFFQAKKLV